MKTPTENGPGLIAEIIARFLEGEASEQDLEQLDAWLREDKANREYFDEVNSAFQVSVTLSRFNQHKIDDAWGRLTHQIGDAPGSGSTHSIRTPFYFLKIAASIGLVALSVFLVAKLISNEGLTQGTIVKNSEGVNTRILLPDSSIVWLNTNSTLEYAPAFGNTSREVSLKGEAFFDVRKGRHDFIVKTENIRVRVKGTKFNVEAYKNSQSTKTTLEEGKIEFQVKGEDVLYIMKPGDQITLNTQLNKVTFKKVNPVNYSAWKEEQLVFDNTSLNDIVSRLESRYKVRIVVDSLLARRERLTMTIERESLEEVLDMIQLSSRLKVKKEKNQIILYE
jgi:ferric-dicitrate binding protein FerR (iron transport regulator)